MTTFHPIFFSPGNCVVSSSLPICVILKMKIGFHSGGLSISFFFFFFFFLNRICSRPIYNVHVHKKVQDIFKLENRVSCKIMRLRGSVSPHCSEIAFTGCNCRHRTIGCKL